VRAAGCPRSSRCCAPCASMAAISSFLLTHAQVTSTPVSPCADPLSPEASSRSFTFILDSSLRTSLPPGQRTDGVLHMWVTQVLSALQNSPGHLIGAQQRCYKSMLLPLSSGSNCGPLKVAVFAMPISNLSDRAGPSHRLRRGTAILRRAEHRQMPSTLWS
jgi:hypothetical protein